MPTGLVMRSTGSRYLVRGDDGTLHDCVAKGNLRIKGWKSTNPVAVGDRVDFLPQLSVDQVGSIMDLHERRNYLVRRSVNLSHHKHVIAANVDQALIVVTVARPRTSYGFIDRFLVTAEAYQIPKILIVFNKVDALDDKGFDLLAEYEDVYRSIGYTTIITSALKGTGVEEVRASLRGKVTLIAGHSGVGKSTLVNAIEPGLDLPTEEISESSEKGQHTTTYAEMFELGVASDESRVASGDHVDMDPTHHSPLATPAGMPPTFLIDTPGIKGFGLVDMEAHEIVDQFPEMFRLKSKCRFNDCSHQQEPGCAVRTAVENGDIAESRYLSYIDMVNGVEDVGPYRLD